MHFNLLNVQNKGDKNQINNPYQYTSQFCNKLILQKHIAPGRHVKMRHVAFIDLQPNSLFIRLYVALYVT